MKRALLVLAMLLMAATSYNQTSRRTSNANGSATRSTEKKAENNTRSSSVRENVNSSQTNTNSRENNATVNNNRTQNQSTSSESRTADDNNNRRTNDDQNNNGYNTNRENHNDNGNRNSHGAANNTQYHNNDFEHHRNGNTNGYYNSSRQYQYGHSVNHSYHKAPYNRDYRAEHYVYREPAHMNVYWTREMHRHYVEMYPEVRFWNYNIGYEISTTSAYFADYYIGEVMNVYGQVSDMFYAPETDEYFLYFGAYYPYHDFTVVLPGEIARRCSHRPMGYFLNQYINVTGLITVFDGKPEIVVKRNFQLNVY
jgi:hypothetical protein